MSLVQIAVKRAMDIFVSFVALVVLSPLLLLIALAVRLTSPGPALFPQTRLGKDSQPFICLKFRTMYVGAPDIYNLDGSTYNAPDDPRVTRVGRFLRKTSLDELPQLIHVLKGEMSLVGPRPDPVYAVSHYRPKDHLRLSVKPGITGLAQINGRNNIPWERRRDMDLEYVCQWSLLLDLNILANTIPYVLTGKGVFGETFPNCEVELAEGK